MANNNDKKAGKRMTKQDMTNVLFDFFHVCITLSIGHELVYQDIQVGCSYRVKSKSVICRGRVTFVHDMEEKRRILDILMKHYTDYPVQYSDPAVRNVCIWKVPVEHMTAREYAAV